MGKIENTTQTSKENPARTLAEAMVFGASGSILRQEANGQEQLVQSADLPVQGSKHPAWEKMGVKFGDPYQEDPIFCPARLPAGWSKQATEHSMHSKLLDDKGRCRGSIFYKAAFYDRRADISPNARFHIRWVMAEDMNVIQHEVTDGDQRVFVSSSTTVDMGPDRYASRQAAIDAQLAECRAFLEPKYPNWEDPSAHWDD